VFLVHNLVGHLQLKSQRQEHIANQSKENTIF
jgi:hypothetical protein